MKTGSDKGIKNKEVRKNFQKKGILANQKEQLKGVEEVREGSERKQECHERKNIRIEEEKI